MLKNKIFVGYKILGFSWKEIIDKNIFQFQGLNIEEAWD